MLVLGQSNQYGFSNAVIRIIDHTIEEDLTEKVDRPLPDFNILIPTVQAIGKTNTLELYYPEETELGAYLTAHGKPNAIKYGFGPDFITGILSRWKSGVGVYTINLRGPSASMGNILVGMKYRVEENVPYVDGMGNQYYIDENQQLTTNPVDGGEVIRDVLHVKFFTANVEDCKKWTDVHEALNAMYSQEEDDEGYRTIPWFGVMYRGASAYANNIYFNMVPKVAEYDNTMRYSINLFDGMTMRSTDPTFSFDVDCGKKYGTTFYMEDVFNKTFPTMRYMTAEDSVELSDLFNKYLYTLDDYINGNTEEPSVTFGDIDPFGVSGFAIEVDSGSLNPQLTNAFRLTGGTDGTESRDELFKMFYEGKLNSDIQNPLRARINYIPDIGYDQPTKKAIIDMVQKRCRTTVCTMMLGGVDSFASAVIDHQGNYYRAMPEVRQLCKCQSPMMYNEYTRRTCRHPATYYDTMALLDHFIRWTNYFQPFAGAEARWTGYIEDTMSYPNEEPEYLQSLHTSRINTVMKDYMSGGYLADQQMNTVLTSDQTEWNNAVLITCMLYDLLDLIHFNHFKFNETEEVRIFNEAVNTTINKKYARHSASLSVSVARVATTGRYKSANKITVSIDMKDINKYTDVDMILVDE